MNQDQSTAVSLGMMAAGMPPIGGMGGLPSLTSNSSAGPSSATGFFGSSLAAFDASGLTINFGDGASQSATTGDRGGNALTPSDSASGLGAGLGMGGISPIYMVGAVLLVLLLVTKKKAKP